MDNNPIEMNANSQHHPSGKKVLLYIFLIILGGIVLLPINSLLLISYEYLPQLFMILVLGAMCIDSVVGLALIFLPFWREPRWLKVRVFAIGSTLLTILAYGLTWAVPTLIPSLIMFLLKIDPNVAHPGITTAELLSPLPLVPAALIFGLLGIGFAIPVDTDVDPRVKQTLNWLTWIALALDFGLILPAAGCTFIIWGLA